RAVLDTGSAAVRHDYQMTFARRREKVKHLAANLRSPVLQIVSGDDLAASLRRELQPGSGSGKS
ncbi:MAG: hypothetical protein JXR89_10555, partial [Deltaproteobacteria bacterium]|nr:hypothetical protein [Deltaproteobacteria bacterium]